MNVLVKRDLRRNLAVLCVEIHCDSRTVPFCVPSRSSVIPPKCSTQQLQIREIRKASCHCCELQCVCGYVCVYTVAELLDLDTRLVP